MPELARSTARPVGEVGDGGGAGGGVHLIPVRGRARIDVLRGLAILGSFYMKLPLMGAPVAGAFGNPTSLGRPPADARAWLTVQVALEGTQRCMLQFLFGAGMMVLTGRIADPEGPVAIADLYLRRTLWLLAFGIFDISGMLGPGNILHVYALAALFLLPFRRMGPETLVAIGSLLALFQLAVGGYSYVDRALLSARHRVVAAEIAAHRSLVPADRRVEADWNAWHGRLAQRRAGPPELAAIAKAESVAHAGGLVPYALFIWNGYLGFIYPHLLAGVIEAFCAMCIGVGL